MYARTYENSEKDGVITAIVNDIKSVKFNKNRNKISVNVGGDNSFQIIIEDGWVEVYSSVTDLKIDNYHTAG